MKGWRGCKTANISEQHWIANEQKGDGQGAPGQTEQQAVRLAGSCVAGMQAESAEKYTPLGLLLQTQTQETDTCTTHENNSRIAATGLGRDTDMSGNANKG
jgi:hypothetical protein